MALNKCWRTPTSVSRGRETVVLERYQEWLQGQTTREAVGSPPRGHVHPQEQGTGRVHRDLCSTPTKCVTSGGGAGVASSRSSSARDSDAPGDTSGVVVVAGCEGCGAGGEEVEKENLRGEKSMRSSRHRHGTQSLQDSRPPLAPRRETRRGSG